MDEVTKHCLGSFGEKTAMLPSSHIPALSNNARDLVPPSEMTSERGMEAVRERCEKQERGNSRIKKLYLGLISRGRPCVERLRVRLGR